MWFETTSDLTYDVFAVFPSTAIRRRSISGEQESTRSEELRAAAERDWQPEKIITAVLQTGAKTGLRTNAHTFSLFFSLSLPQYILFTTLNSIKPYFCRLHKQLNDVCMCYHCQLDYAYEMHPHMCACELHVASPLDPKVRLALMMSDWANRHFVL